jgi:hypothetical protein
MLTRIVRASAKDSQPRAALSRMATFALFEVGLPLWPVARRRSKAMAPAIRSAICKPSLDRLSGPDWERVTDLVETYADLHLNLGGVLAELRGDWDT